MTTIHRLTPCDNGRTEAEAESALDKACKVLSRSATRPSSRP